jgi:hypothetical protein
MPQFAQRYRRLALISVVSVSCAAALGCSSATHTAIEVDAESLQEVSGQDEIGVSQQGVSTGSSQEEGMVLESLDEVLSSYSKETGQLEGDEAVAAAEKPYSPLEYASHFVGGVETILTDVPLLTGIAGRLLKRFLEPVSFAFYAGKIYIVDAAASSIWRYDPSNQTIINVMDGSLYFKGAPGKIIFSDNGYLYASDPLGKRVLKFNPNLELVGIFEDVMNLGAPGSLVFDEVHRKLYVADTVYSRILVFNERGEALYAVGSRGERPGEFVAITDFTIDDDGIYITDRIGKPMQGMSYEGEPLLSFGEDDLSIPSAIVND